jgi:hypothetical protein
VKAPGDVRDRGRPEGGESCASPRFSRNRFSSEASGRMTQGGRGEGGASSIPSRGGGRRSSAACARHRGRGRCGGDTSSRVAVFSSLA